MLSFLCHTYELMIVESVCRVFELIFYTDSICCLDYRNYRRLACWWLNQWVIHLSIIYFTIGWCLQLLDFTWCSFCCKNENCISKTRNHQTEDKLEFLRHSNSFGIRKEQNDQYAYKSPKSRQKDTMSCVKNSTALGIELSVVLGERSNQCTDNLKYKIPRRPRDFESSKKRKVQDTHKLDIIKSKSMGEEDILVCSKRTTELPFRKGLEANKCLTALKKKRILEDAILINNLEDDKVYVPSKTYSRSKARKMDDVKVIVFLNAYSL